MNDEAVPDRGESTTIEPIVVSRAGLELRIDPRTGEFLSLCRQGGCALLVRSGTSGTRVVIGGTPGLNHIPKPGNVPMRSEWDFNSITTPAQRGLPDDAIMLGTDAHFLGAEQVDTGPGLRLTVCHEQDGWQWSTHYTLNHVLPVLGLDITVRRPEGSDVSLDFVEWFVDCAAAGTHPLDGICTEIGNGIHRPGRDGGSLVFWRLAEGEFGRWTVAVGDSSVSCFLGMGSAGTMPHPVTGGGFLIAAGDDPIDAANASRRFNTLAGQVGAPGRPDWAYGQIYETMIGVWPQDGKGNKYAPYPRTADLIADLPRIAGLGFTILYLMPHHPYPSYSTVSLTDLDAQHGDGAGAETTIADLVGAAHSIGLRVIVDLVLHGVMDADSVAAQEERHAIAPPQNDSGFTGHHWDRMEKAFQDDWRREATADHPYCVDHPEWFSQLPDGRLHITYTKAFDLRHPGLRTAMANAYADLHVNPGLDGIRFDAPSWNRATYRWKEDLGYRASWSTGAGNSMIREISDAVLRVNPDALMFSEGADIMSTSTGHLQYPYDEWSTLEALMSGIVSVPQARSRLEFIRTLRPTGSAVANWLDSHDSVWWPEEGKKWRREVYSLPLFRMMTCINALRGGAYMMYSGGEKNVEDLLPGLFALRQKDRILRLGTTEENVITCEDDLVFPILRRIGREWRVVVGCFGGPRRTVRLGMPNDCKSPDTGLFISYGPDDILPTFGPGRSVTVTVSEFQMAVISPTAPELN